MQNLYTTPQASELTGIKESTIRSWLRRHPEIFQLDVHLIADEHGQKLWTEAGIDLLRSRAPNSAPPDDANSDADDETPSLLESLLEHDAQVLAQEYWRQLPVRVLRQIKRMREQPTPQERQIVVTSVRAALNAGTSHLLLPVYQPMLLGGEDE